MDKLCTKNRIFLRFGHTLSAAWQGSAYVGLALATLALSSQLSAQEQTRDGDWLTSTDPKTGKNTFTMELRLVPASEPRPALKVRFIPDDYERIDGNSSMFYLKATGFFEQSVAKQKLTEYYRKAVDEAQESGTPLTKVAPWVWLETPPSDLPLDEVREFLVYTSFQPYFLEEAALRRGFSMDRAIQRVDNPIAYLLPEIQAFRETARLQSTRTRLALGEERVEDAIKIIGQQFAMANHLCQDDFLVSGLVGIAIHNIAWVDALYLCQQSDAPNLYWAYAALPSDLVMMRKANRFERNILYEQVKVLSEVGEEPRSIGYWNDFIDRLLPQLKGLEVEGLKIVNEGVSPGMQRTQLVAFIGASYPTAREFLIDDVGMEQALVDEYPVAQAVMLALCKFHDQWRDELWKWRLLPYHEVLKGLNEAEERMRERGKKLGFVSSPAMLFLPAMKAAIDAECRAKMMRSLAQTIESIRAYASENDGDLPESLSQLTLPAPPNPYTGKPLGYERTGDGGVLTAEGTHIRYRLILQK